MAQEAKKKMKKRPKKAKPPKLPWRQRVTLSGVILWSVLATILMVSTGIGSYALYVLHNNKLTDTWAILFLELEQQGNWLLQRLEEFADQRANASSQRAIGEGVSKADIVLRIQGDGTLAAVVGNIPDRMKLKDVHLSDTNFASKWMILQYGGKDYLAFKSGADWLESRIGKKISPGQYLVLWDMDMESWFAAGNDQSENTLYFITKEGRVVYTNDRTINNTNYVKRPLVQKFISNPLRHGQLEFGMGTKAAYGFFYEVPGTNVMMFVETLKSVALAEVQQLAIRFGVVLLVVIAILGILLQYPLTSFVVSPMRELVRVADEVGDGNFDVHPRREGLGELSVLTRSFTEMAKNLIIRDERIQSLLQEQKEKFRLEDELALAHSIQNNFLMHGKLPEESGVDVASKYVPAAECAGDWYGYYFDPHTVQSVFAIADVSGHGAASAMFTAIIAATFEEHRTRSAEHNQLFDILEFAKQLNRTFISLGHGQMHATLLVASYRKGSQELQILNAGHPFPLLVPPEESHEPNEPVLARADMVGINEDFTAKVLTIPFPKGMSLFMFTDGLIEGSPDNRVYSERKLSKSAHITAAQPVNQLVVRVFEDWKRHLKGQQATDDVCLLGIKAAA